MMGEVHGLCQPSEVHMSLLVDHAIVSMIDRELAGTLNTVKTPNLVDQWMKNMLPCLCVWLPLAVVGLVSPENVSPEQLVQLASNVDDHMSYFYYICFKS
jgi:hypothetical protein